MYKVILVDDEEWVVESLKTCLIWEDYGFQVVGQVYKAEDALAMIAEIKPDLVFTDIKMPGMSGLELLKRVKMTNPEVHFVVASGHAEFVYAQKALQYGAIAYCLKPFEDNEIMDCLHKTRSAIEARSKPRQPGLYELLFEQEEIHTEQIQKLLEANRMQDELAVVQTIGRESLDLTCPFPHLSYKAGVSKKIYVLQQSDLQLFFQHLALSERVTSAGYQEHVTDIEGLKRAIERANIASFHYFITGSKGLYPFVPSAYYELRNLLKRLHQAFENKNLAALDFIFGELQLLFQTKGYTIKHAFFVYNQILNYANDWFYTQTNIEIDSFEQLPNQYANVTEMLMALGAQIKAEIAAVADTVTPDVEHRTIREMVKHVNQNFYKDVNIQQLAREFYVTPNYISHLFKKEMGINFTEYVTKLRIDYACRLLQESHYTIQQISEMSGFNDYFYFTRIFKKISGKTPSDYKKSPNVQ